MTDPVLASLARVLDADSGVAPEYRHQTKRVAPLDPLTPPGAVLKWYGIFPEDRPIPDAITARARDFLLTTEMEARGLGFVLLHRCGDAFYFLIACTWRGSNELWETVFYKDGDAMADFARWPRESVHLPTFCVWELAAVEHERRAWSDFLRSPRDEAAARAWLRDHYAGAAE